MTRRRPAALLLAAAFLTATGCTDRSDPMTPADPAAALKAYLDTIPKPPGSTLIDEHVEPGQGGNATSVRRIYRTTGTRPACAQLIDAAKGWTVGESPSTPLDAATCDPTGPPDASGQPPGRNGYIRPTTAALGAVTLAWRYNELIFSLTEGDVPKS